MAGTDDTWRTPHRCDAETELRLVRIALQVRDDLAQAGIPAVYAGSSFDGLSRVVSGAVVFHAPYSDDSAGVYVKWAPHPELTRQLLGPGGPDPWALAVGSAAAEAMRSAVRTILGAAGWVASEYANSAGGELYLKIGEQSPVE